ncbi:hypothetical protein FQA39_LY04552 [Lamprigera yunnana]|nr:hypothetical protein FQA39_LY04552 [Lamprigera yunnana]
MSNSLIQFDNVEIVISDNDIAEIDVRKCTVTKLFDTYNDLNDDIICIDESQSDSEDVFEIYQMLLIKLEKFKNKINTQSATSSNANLRVVEESNNAVRETKVFIRDGRRRQLQSKSLLLTRRQQGPFLVAVLCCPAEVLEANTKPLLAEPEPRAVIYVCFVTVVSEVMRPLVSGRKQRFTPRQQLPSLSAQLRQVGLQHRKFKKDIQGEADVSFGHVEIII